MGIRESLNEKPMAVVMGAAVVLVLALIVLVYHLWPASKSRITAKEFYSDDDGTTWFVDDANKVAPFDHNGKEAVKARVYICGSNKFVAYLIKFSPDAKAKMEGARQDIKPGIGKVAPAFDPRLGILYKKPHDEKWVTEADADYKQVVTVHCPDGRDNFLLPLVP